MAAPELKTLGRYKIERVLGQGSIGVVYEGVDPKLHRRVAIKTILKARLHEATVQDFSARFLAEAQALARLIHPDLVRVLDFGDDGEAAYLVMEFVRGRTLQSLVDSKRALEPAEMMRIMGELCDALDYAHDAGVVHRDLKPGNVIFDVQGRTRLTDFGLACLQEGGQTVLQRTQGGTMVGTPAYMSPERISGAPVDRRSDVFSAGVILYQLLTGELPFTGARALSVARKILQDDPPPPSRLNARVTAALDVVVAKALAKDPKARYASARQLRLALEHAVEGDRASPAYDQTAVSGDAPTPEELRRERKRMRSMVIAAMAIVVFATGAIGAWTLSRQRQESNLEKAALENEMREKLAAEKKAAADKAAADRVK